jgi:hypothetical protein
MSSDNVTMTVEETTTKEEVADKPVQKQQVSLLQIPIGSENDALNMLVAFLQVAQKRGAFSLEEAGKIMEAVNRFQRTAPSKVNEPLETVEEEVVTEQ